MEAMRALTAVHFRLGFVDWVQTVPDTALRPADGARVSVSEAWLQVERALRQCPPGGADAQSMPCVEWALRGLDADVPQDVMPTLQLALTSPQCALAFAPALSHALGGLERVADVVSGVQCRLRSARTLPSSSEELCLRPVYGKNSASAIAVPCRCRADVSARQFNLTSAAQGPVAAMLTCAARIAEDLSSSAASAEPVNAVASATDERTWGVLVMSDTPVIQDLAASDAAFRQHLVRGEGRVGHLGQSCKGGCVWPLSKFHVSALMHANQIHRVGLPEGL